jgi:hypothetical protein
MFMRWIAIATVEIDRAAECEQCAVSTCRRWMSVIQDTDKPDDQLTSGGCRPSSFDRDRRRVVNNGAAKLIAVAESRDRR